MKNEAEQNVNYKKSLRRKYIITAGIFLLFITPVFIFILLSQNPKPDPASERIIRESIAKQLNKDPNELTNEDFAKLSTLLLFPMNWPQNNSEHIYLSDIIIIEKCINLSELDLVSVTYPKEKIPEWMKILDRIGVINLKDKIFIDLTPLANLTNLRILSFYGSEINNIEPLAKLTNLVTLELNNTNVSNLEPLSKLTNLETLELVNIQILNIEPLKNLNNLRILSLYGTQISDLGPLEGLNSLELLDIRNCPNITVQEVEDMQKTLPNLEIRR